MENICMNPENLGIYYNVNSSLFEDKQFQNLKTFLETDATLPKDSIFVIDTPIMDGAQYTYNYDKGFLLLIKNHKIMFFASDDRTDEFQRYQEYFLEDTGALARKYLYTELIGRTADWRDKGVIVSNSLVDKTTDDISCIVRENKLSDIDSRLVNLIISLLTGSINDISKISKESFEIEQTLLESVKNRIMLFDTNQTRFVYQEDENKDIIRIQGLAGSGKTELLLHKLKKLYVEDKGTKIAFTCFNKVLADKLKGRVPEFFNYMKVDEQIDYNRLFICSSWGSARIPDSGLYSKICNHYGLEFHRFNRNVKNSEVWQEAIDSLKEREFIEPLFDYILLDESQDFEEEFIALCNLVTRRKVYVAGDILQNIFSFSRVEGDKQIGQATDFLLNKVYRTDPRTVLFSHVIGFGLFERKAVRWLSNKEWLESGYKIENISENEFNISREPLNRFGEEIDERSYSAVIVRETEGDYNDMVIDSIRSLRQTHKDIAPSDIAVVYVHYDKNVSNMAEELSQRIYNDFKWFSVIAPHEKRVNDSDELLITNINNVKGLEFSFVIIVNNHSILEIDDNSLATDIRYRNALYMSLTRSFISSILIVNPNIIQEGYVDKIKTLCQDLDSYGASINIKKPSEIVDESDLYNLDKKEFKSQHDIIEECIKELDIPKDKVSKLLSVLVNAEKIENGTTDKEEIKSLIKLFNGVI